jgi:glycosyltransferase involved in cell wall biosynthesis
MKATSTRAQSRRVLMTGDSVGGVWSYVLDLSRSLDKYGYEVDLALMGRPPTAAQREQARAIPSLTLLERPYKLEWMDEPWTDIGRSRAWLREVECERSPDIIHLNGFSYATAGFQAPSLIVAHSCVLSWWRAVHGSSAPDVWLPYYREVRAGLHAANAIVAPTRAMLAALREHYGITKGGRVISNGTDLTRYAAASKEPFIFCAGRIWDAAKNIRTLEVAATSSAWPFYIAGDRTAPDAISSDRERALEATALQFLGQLEREAMTSWLGRAAIYVHPARYEPFGLTVLEAAASACALILADIPSLRELWEGAAVFVSPGDEQAWKTTIGSLLGDSTERERLGRAAQDRSRRYHLESFGRAYVDLYDSLAGLSSVDVDHLGTGVAP